MGAQGSPQAGYTDFEYSVRASCGQCEGLNFSARMWRRRVMLHDPSGAAVLRLVREAVALHDAPLAPPPYQLNDDGQWQAMPDPADLPTARGEGAPPRPLPRRAVETGSQARPAALWLPRSTALQGSRRTAAERRRAFPKWLYW